MMTVCGANNETYYNECLAECDGAEVQCGGACPCPQRLIDPRVEENPEVRDLWQRLMRYITTMWGASSEDMARSTTGKVKFF